MKKQKGHLIKSVDPGSIAEELELEPGDRLLTINGNEVEDIFDYEYYVDSESMVMLEPSVMKVLMAKVFNLIAPEYPATTADP